MQLPDWAARHPLALMLAACVAGGLLLGWLANPLPPETTVRHGEASWAPPRAAEIQRFNDATFLSLRQSTVTGFHVLRVHSWLLYARWRWFQLLITSGLEEATQKSATLPSSMSPALLQPSTTSLPTSLGLRRPSQTSLTCGICPSRESSPDISWSS